MRDVLCVAWYQVARVACLMSICVRWAKTYIIIMLISKILGKLVDFVQETCHQKDTSSDYEEEEKGRYIMMVLRVRMSSCAGRGEVR